MNNIASPRLSLVIRARNAYKNFLNNHNRLKALSLTANYLETLGYPPDTVLNIVHSL